MAPSAIARYSKATSPPLNYQFKDDDLIQIANELSSPVDRVADEIAERLLLDFSLNYGNLVCCVSDRLYDRYIEWIQFYDEVRNAVASKCNVEDIDLFKSRYETVSAYEPISKAHLVERIKLRAFLSHDLIRTFPRCCACREVPQTDVATTLFKVVDEGSSFDAEDAAAFFFKFIAVYTEPKKYLTWNDLALEWASHTGHGASYSKIRQTLPFFG